MLGAKRILGYHTFLLCLLDLGPTCMVELGPHEESSMSQTSWPPTNLASKVMNGKTPTIEVLESTPPIVINLFLLLLFKIFFPPLKMTVMEIPMTKKEPSFPS